MNTLPTGDVARARANVACLSLLATLPSNVDHSDLTDEQIDTLNSWCGWGPMAKVLDPREQSEPWATLRTEANQYFARDPKLLDAAERATPTAFYTPDWVMAAAWQIITDFGTPAGPVLEPGCGSGRFIGCAPDGFTVHGVEADPTSARIARLLNPTATIYENRLEQQPLPAGYVAAVGNVPYGGIKITPYGGIKITDRSMSSPLSLHNYFLARSVRAVMPGGLVVALTSRFTLDAERDWTGREAIAEYADLIGAVRLPNGAMRDAGTDVIADLIVLRRRDDVKADYDNSWTVSDSYHHIAHHGVRRDIVPGFRLPVHATFADPTLVLGTLTGTTSGRYGNDPELVVRNDGNPADQMPAAVSTILRRLRGHKPPAAPAGAPETLTCGDNGLNDGTYQRVEGKMFRVEGGQLVPCRAGRELHDLVSLRNMVLELIDADVNQELADDTIAGVRAIALALYRSYVGKYGPLNRCTIVEGAVDDDTGVATRTRRRPSMGGFRSDPHYVTVLSIEDYDDDTGEAKPGAILCQRVNRRIKPTTHVDSLGEGVAVSMDQRGCIDVDYIAALLGSVDVDRVRMSLIDEGEAFVDPSAGRLVPADEYLSGDVRMKLAEARNRVDDDPMMAVNVAALEQVQPVDLSPQDIRVKLGAPWVPVDVVEDFVSYLLSVPRPSATVEHEPQVAAWQVTTQHYRHTAIATATWGTSRVDGFALIELALNGSQALVQDPVWGVDGKKRMVRNDEETMLANEKMREIQERFSEWVWEDPNRANRLAHIYNARYNAIAPRVFSGANLTFPGIRAGFELYESQRQMVHRILSSEATLCGHSVGAGKTAIMGCAAMSMRRLGMVRKPMIVVPNHLTEQIAREIKSLYPTARLLMANREDATKDRRRAFAAKVATGDWDMVVMAHSTFTAIPVSDATETEWINEQLVEYRTALLDDVSGNKGARTFKSVQQAAQKLETRLQGLREKHNDNGVTWEQLGVDYLFVDEAHSFKNLSVPTRSQALAVKGSKRATDLEMKLWAMRRTGQKRVATLLTGTPVSNTLAEMFVLQRYLSPGRLRHLDLHLFDAWAAMFVEFETKVEVAPDGGSFRSHRRPSRFCNVAELLTEFMEVADVRDRATLGLDGPAVRDVNEVTPGTPEMKAYVDALVERSDAIRRGQVDPKKDNMLMVCNDGRKAALDLELVGVYSSDPGKLAPVVQRVVDTWRAHQDNQYLDVHGQVSPRRGALQIVFCDLGTPKPGDTQVYGKLRRQMIAAGIPADEIRFVHDAQTDSAKAALFAECRGGRVAVLFGSTEKLGLGTNVQHRCVAIHHVDAPWRPADVEQRTGRAIRPGNQNTCVDVVRYVREGSFDAYMWQTLERKARFISQVMRGDRSLRETEDIGESTLSYTEVKALATGNPLLMEHAEAVSEVARLQRLRRSHERAMAGLQRQADVCEAEAEAIERHARWLAGLAATADATLGIQSVPGWEPGTEGDGLDDANVAGRAIAARVYAAVGHPIGNKWMDGAITVDLATVNGVPLVLDYRKSPFGSEHLRVKAHHDTELGLVTTLEPSWFQVGQTYRIAKHLVEVTGSLESTSDGLFLHATRKRASADAALAERTGFGHDQAMGEALARKAEVEARMNEGITAG